MRLAPGVRWPLSRTSRSERVVRQLRVYKSDMGLIFSSAQLDSFGQRARKIADEELQAMGRGAITGTIAQDGGHPNPGISLETEHGMRTFQVEFSSSDDELREAIRRDLRRAFTP